MAVLCSEWCVPKCSEGCIHSKWQPIDDETVELIGCELHPELEVDDEYGCDDFVCWMADTDNDTPIYADAEKYEGRTRADRRKTDFAKAKRKRDICINAYGWEYYHAGLHMYSKNKIHCSCPLCASKTRGAVRKATGRSEDWKISDTRKRDSMSEQEKELEEGVVVDGETERLDDEP